MIQKIPSGKAREYKPSTKRRLDTLSGNLCAKPGCTKKLVGEDGKTIVSKICHIEAAEKGGARYNLKMSDDQRRDYDNLILLCDEHHSIIDNKENEVEYSVELLKRWKSDHEKKNIQKKLEQNPTLLGEVIASISAMEFDQSKNSIASTKSFKIQEKIDYNKLVRYRPIIDAYKIYYGKIDKIYQELDRQGSNKKSRLLRNIELIYIKIKGEFINQEEDSISQIREKADSIMDRVEAELVSKINGDKNDNNYSEDKEFAIMLIMVDAFMRCKILEKPILNR